MRIAILAPYWNPPIFRGGISRVIFELRRAWLAAGHNVAVFSPEARASAEEGVYRIPVPGIPLQSVWIALYLAGARRLSEYDIIFPQSALLALFADRKRCVPFVHTLSSAEARGEAWRLWRRLYPSLETLALRKLRRVITLSDDSVQRLVSVHGVPPETIFKVSNGVDTATFSPGPASVRRGFVVASAGRFIPRKRFDLLLRAFARLRARCPDARLILAGDGELGPRLRGLAQELGLGTAVFFPGLLDEAGMLGLYREADVFALPSDVEGMPMVVLEAQACAVPVVVGPFASARKVVVDGLSGFVVEDGEQAWADALGRFVGDEAARATMGARARAHVEASFGWNRTAGKILACFEQVGRG